MSCGTRRRQRRAAWTLVGGIFFLAAQAPAFSASWFVDASRPDDLGDGASWAAAKKTLPAAYNAAAAGDSLHVAAGSYCGIAVSKNNLSLLGGYPAGGGMRNPALYVSTVTQCSPGSSPAISVSANGVRVDGFRFTDGFNGESARLVWVSGGQDFVFVNNLVEGLNVRDGGANMDCPFADLSCVHSAADASGLEAQNAAGLRVQGNVFRNISVVAAPPIVDDGCCTAYQFEPVMKGRPGRSARAVHVVDSCNILIEANTVDDIRGGKGGGVHVAASSPCFSYSYQGGDGGGAYGMVFTRSGGIVVENAATNLVPGDGGVVCAAAAANCGSCASPTSPGAAGASAPVFDAEPDPACPITGGPSLHLTGASVKDCGNHNGAPDRGETISWYLTLTNSGTEAAYNVSNTTLSTASSLVDMLAAKVRYTTPRFPTIAVGESKPSVSPFIYRLNPLAPYQSTQDFILTVKATTAGGYPYQKDIPVSATVGDFGIVPLLDENFEAGLPASWAVADGPPADGFTWAFDDLTTPPNWMPTKHVGVVMNGSVTDAFADEYIYSPVMDASFHQNLTLSFDIAFVLNGLGGRSVSVKSALTGGSWVVLESWPSQTYMPTPQTHAFDITAYAAGAPDVQIRWHVDDYFEYGDGTFIVLDNARVAGRKMADNPADCGSAAPASDIQPGSVQAEPAAPVVPGLSTALVTWNGTCPGGAADYVVYVGNLDMLRATGGDYAAANTLAVTCSTGGVQERLCPAPQSTVFYLVGVLEDDVVEGSLGKNSAGVLRPQGPAPCRPRRENSCP